MNNLPVIIIGAGGHGRVVADALRSQGAAILGFTDANASLWGTEVNGIPVLGADAVIEEKKDEIQVAIGVGIIGQNPTRRILIENLCNKGYRFASLMHKSAVVSAFAILEKGAQVMAGAVVQPGALIGAYSIINTGAVVDHDCRIGEHCHVAPGAVLCGGVAIGAGCYISAGATVIQGVTLGDGCMVAAGAVVTKDFASGSTLMGVPAQAKTL